MRALEIAADPLIGRKPLHWQRGFRAKLDDDARALPGGVSGYQAELWLAGWDAAHAAVGTWRSTIHILVNGRNA